MASDTTAETGRGGRVDPAAAPLLQLRGLKKHFGAVQALDGADLTLYPGQVTALAGDNGAGKSVLVKCIAGIHEADGGEILWQGEPVRIRSPRDSAELGIEVVYQDLALCDNLDIVQNMFLGRERLASGILDEDSMERSASEVLSSLSVTTLRSIRQPVSSLSGGQRQSIAVAKAVMWNSRLVILDEPTAALGVAQTRQVLALVRRLADQGLAVMMISHNLNDVFAVADRIAILRLGRMVGEGPMTEFDPPRVVDLMTIGHSERKVVAKRSPAEREPAPTIPPPAEPTADQAAGRPSAVVGADRTPSLGEYATTAWSRILAGQSGVLPVVLGAVLIAAIFQVENAKFLSAGNLVNLLVQGSVFMLIGMGEVFILILGEIDLSLGFVAGIGATVTTILVQPGMGWPWWAAIAAALAATAGLGLLQGLLITRLRLPSFVVTLAGLLGFQGLMIALLGAGGTIPIPSDTINNLANGTLSRAGGWILAALVVGGYALFAIRRDNKRRRSGLVAPPPGLTLVKIGTAAAAAALLVAISNVNRGIPRFPLNGMPWVVPIVFAVLMLWSVLLAATRFGRYLYAIGGNAEAARRAGVSLARIRTLAFVLAAMTAGLGGIIYASRLRSISTSFDGGTVVLYVVATAVIGGTSLFGGRGQPIHAILGGIIIAGIVNGMALLGLPAAIQLMATAAVLLASITVDVVVRRRGETAR